MDTQTKNCKNCNESFIIEPDDFTFYAKIDVPLPTLCPRCRRMRRLSFRNDRDYYKRNCDLCKRSIVALYPVDAKFPVYCMKCWWSDGWDPTSYGREYDPARSFFEQCHELFETVPTIAMQNDDSVGSVNCEYTTDWWFSKNCYMAMTGWQNENVIHSYHVEHTKDALDCSHIKHCQQVYGCLGSTKCTRCSYCTYCHDSFDCFLSYDLRGCSDCVMCVGLRNKQYCILNVQYTKEEYFEKLKTLRLESRASVEEHKKSFQQFILKFPHRYAQILKSTTTTGDMLMNCKNSQDCYFGNALENCKFIVLNDGAKETYDCNATGHPELCYESITPDYSYGCIGTIFSVRCRNVDYSNNCPGAEQLLGCAGMKKGSYAILNKIYSSDEYHALRTRIVDDMKRRGEWGEFFPASMSPFAYNESIAYDFDPLTEEQARALQLRWKRPFAREYKTTLTSQNVPDTMESVKEDILKEIIGCAHTDKQGTITCNEKCTTAFRITSSELTFYRSRNIPLPTLCPNCRHYQRIEQRNPVQLWHRKCANPSTSSGQACENEFETSYAPDRPEIIYCESCYQNEIM